jgi:hypothetical protein
MSNDAKGVPTNPESKTIAKWRLEKALNDYWFPPIKCTNLQDVVLSEGQKTEPSELIQLFQILTESSEQLTNRRQGLNTFFLTINTALIGAIGWLASTLVIKPGDFMQMIHFVPREKFLFALLLAATGMGLCFIWCQFLKSYNIVSQSKIEIVKVIEQELPYRLFSGQYSIVENDDNHYWPFTTLELLVCLVFLFFHSVIFLLTLLSLAFKPLLLLILHAINQIAL